MRHGIAPVRDNIDGNISRHRRPINAAIRLVTDASATTAAVTFRREHTPRKHARTGATGHASCAEYTFRQPVAGYSLSRCRAQCCVAAIPRYRSYWFSPFWFGAVEISKNYSHNDLKIIKTSISFL